MLLSVHALRESVAARLETVGCACRAGRINGQHPHSAAGEPRQTAAAAGE
jgi:hypothetical protein